MSAPPRPATVRVRVHASAPRRRPAGRRKPAARRSTTRRSPARRSGRRKGAGRTYDLSRWWPALLVVVAVLVGVAWDNREDAMPDSPALCTLPSSNLTLTEEQIGNARTIAQVAWDRGLPDRAVVIALATAMQESKLRNLDYGDRDSLGLFQQRPSMGWGSEAQVQDPVYAAGIFYDRLVEVPGWDTRSVVDASDRVQRSAYPERVGQWETMATELTAALAANGSGAMPCR
jgi:hypothetical protein